jgi:hypothetical protein
VRRAPLYGTLVRRQFLHLRHDSDIENGGEVALRRPQPGQQRGALWPGGGVRGPRVVRLRESVHVGGPLLQFPDERLLVRRRSSLILRNIQVEHLFARHQFFPGLVPGGVGAVPRNRTVPLFGPGRLDQQSQRLYLDFF